MGELGQERVVRERWQQKQRARTAVWANQTHFRSALQLAITCYMTKIPTSIDAISIHLTKLVSLRRRCSAANKDFWVFLRWCSARNGRKGRSGREGCSDCKGRSRRRSSVNRLITFWVVKCVTRDRNYVNMAEKLASSSPSAARTPGDKFLNGVNTVTWSFAQQNVTKSDSLQKK